METRGEAAEAATPVIAVSKPSTGIPSARRHRDGASAASGVGRTGRTVDVMSAAR